jgi:hypothetical protein
VAFCVNEPEVACGPDQAVPLAPTPLPVQRVAPFDDLEAVRVSRATTVDALKGVGEGRRRRDRKRYRRDDRPHPYESSQAQQERRQPNAPNRT